MFFRSGKLIHVPDIAVKNVLKQKIDNGEVKPGKMVPKGAEVDLVVGKGSNERAGIPNLIGYHWDEAEDIIIQNAMNVGAIRPDTTINSEEDSTEAFIWQQYPPYDNDKQIKLGTYIDLWISVDSSKLPGVDTTHADTSQIKLKLNEGDSLQ
mgnify:CR=1 FL=1